MTYQRHLVWVSAGYNVTSAYSRWTVLTVHSCTRKFALCVWASFCQIWAETGPLLDCNDTLIDSTVNEMFGQFVSCRPGLGRSYWLAASLGNPTHHRSKPQSCLVSRRTMTSVLILIAFVFNLYVQKFLKKYRLRSLSYDKPSNLY